jgi:beta-lactam-binding protein with PASTA domain
MGPTEETDSVPRGAIARVEPRPQTRLAPNCPVTLRVAVPVPKIQVPNYVKRTLADVKQTLKGGAAGLFEPFRLGTVRTEDNNPVRSGNDQLWTVIAQDPPAGKMVPRPSGIAVATTINLTVRLNRQDSQDGPITIR